jgi:hypothetical protein
LDNSFLDSAGGNSWKRLTDEKIPDLVNKGVIIVELERIRAVTETINETA